MADSRFFRAPLAHFVLAGGVMFAVDAWVATPSTPPAEAARAPIVISAAQVEQIRSEVEEETGRAPSDEDEAALVERVVEEEMLYREALVRGLDRGDRSIRWRLIEKMRFLSADDDVDPEARYREALALGLDRDDAIVRRILIEKMRLAADAEVGEPSEAELRDYLERHREEYVQPARLTFWHAFFGAQRGGERAESEVQRLLAEVEREPVAPEQVVARGDAFPFPTHQRGLSMEQMGGRFGAEFADEVAKLAPGRWSGPIRSVYGVHAVLLEEAKPARVSELSEVRSRVAEGLRVERRKERVVDLLRRLRERYEVRVEVGSTARTSDG